MRSGRLSTALVVLAIALPWVTPAFANPGCSLGDLGQAASDTFNNIPLSCASQAADPAFYPLLGFLLAATQTPQGVAFCNEAEQASADASKLANDLKSLPGSSVIAPVVNSLNSDADAAAAALDVVTCACKTAEWKGPGEIATDLGDCVADALCAVQNTLFGDCEPSKPPPPPQQILCTIDPCPAVGECDASIPLVGEPNEQCGGDPGYRCQGSVCFSNSLVVPGYDPSDQGYYCYCPPVMQHRPIPAYCHTGDITLGECTNYLLCQCPENTHSLSSTGAGQYICMCDDSGLVANDDGSCPAPPPLCEPSCPAGQVLHINDANACTYSCNCPDGLTRAGDKCVTPCTDASQIMLASGACCSPSQATSCGTCCPDGMKPDADGDSCVAATLPINQIPSPPASQPAKKQ